MYFYRLKKIQEKKKKLRKEAEELKIKLREEGIALQEADNILEGDRDEDLLFN
jgi:hypothetical protein